MTLGPGHLAFAHLLRHLGAVVPHGCGEENRRDIVAVLIEGRPDLASPPTHRMALDAPLAGDEPPASGGVPWYGWPLPSSFSRAGSTSPGPRTIPSSPSATRTGWPTSSHRDAKAVDVYDPLNRLDEWLTHATL